MSRKQKIIVSLITVALVAILTFSGIGWGFTHRDLDVAKNELSGAKMTLATKEGELSAIRDELSAIKNELKSMQAYLSSAEAGLQSANNFLLKVKTELEDTKTKLANLQGNAYNLHNLTSEEVIEFMEIDKTNLNEYVEGKYVCSHFVRDVNDNAERQGIRCAIVLISFPEQSHAIVAFNTTDEGMVYFDAITDDRVKPVIGKEYSRCIEPKNSRNYAESDFDDTIEDIIVIW